MTRGFLFKGIAKIEIVTQRYSCKGNSWLAGVVSGRASYCVEAMPPFLAPAGHCCSFIDGTWKHKMKDLIKELALGSLAIS